MNTRKTTTKLTGPVIIRMGAPYFDLKVGDTHLDLAADCKDLRAAGNPEREVKKYLGDVARMVCNLRGIKSPPTKPPSLDKAARAALKHMQRNDLGENDYPMSMRLRRAA